MVNVYNVFQLCYLPILLNIDKGRDIMLAGCHDAGIIRDMYVKDIRSIDRIG